MTEDSNEPTPLAKELAEHIRQRETAEWERSHPDGAHTPDKTFQFEEGMVVRKEVEMEWALKYLRETGRLKDVPPPLKKRGGHSR
jgi:hypothetical protein